MKAIKTFTNFSSLKSLISSFPYIYAGLSSLVLKKGKSDISNPPATHHHPKNKKTTKKKKVFYQDH